MDLGALDGALGSWRRERELKAWGRYQELQVEARNLRRRAEVTRLMAGRELGALGEHASDALRLETEADAVTKKLRWWKLHRLTVRRYEERRQGCGDWTYEGFCQHCGLCHAWRQGCGAHVVCADCARARSKRLARKLIPAIRLQHARAMAKWHGRGRPSGQMPLISLVTLTLRSNDVADLEDRRKLLSSAWNRFRTWFAEAHGWKLSYAWTAECTEGQASQGHVHLHVVTMLPLVDYKRLNAAWESATKGHGGHVDFSKRRSDPKRAALYIAKYASKGVKFESVQVAAAWVRAQHAKRGVSTSREWWWTDEVTHGPWVLTKRRTEETLDGEPHPGGTRGHDAEQADRQQRAGPAP